MVLLRRVGRRIVAFRERRGLSQLQLARRARIARSTLRYAESGTHAVSLLVLARIAHVLKVEVRTLLPTTTKTRRRRR